MIIFNRANKKDCKELSIIKKYMWDQTYRGIYDDEEIDDFDYLKHELKFISKLDKENLYVIKDDEKIIGYFSFGTPSYAYKNFELALNSLYIINDYQGKGIGKSVLKFVFDYCKNHHIKEFYTCCNLYNKNALMFYTKNGGVITLLENDSSNKSKHQYYLEFKVN